MIQDMSVTFLRKKITELENALFMSETNALVNLPTHIVRVSEVDEEGNVWFIIPRPTQVIESFPGEMSAKLDFFKKGKEFFLKISGVASIVWNVNEMKEASLSKQFSDSIRKGDVAIKVKVEIAEYIEKTPKPSSNPFLNVGNQVYNWLLNPLFNV
jgi:general stress protein 26